MGLSNKDKALALLMSLETGSRDALQYINPDKYIQHNLSAPDGVHPELLDAITKMLAGTGRVSVIRVFEDGDYVFTHTAYELFGPKVGFDVFRFENGLVVEHWDNLMERAAGPNASGHTQIDGDTIVRDLDKTQANKALVREFFAEVVIGGRFEQLGNYFRNDACVQHSPHLVDGVTKAAEAMVKAMSSGYRVQITELKMVLGQGNFVLAGLAGTLRDKPAAFYDLFRLQEGKIVERWEVVEETLPRDQWKNQNGKF